MVNFDLILLISIDCLRADHLCCYGYHRETSPFIDELAENGIKFLGCYANSSSTTGSIPGLLLSRYPWEAYRKFGGGRAKLLNLPSLQSILRSNGYKTALMHFNPYMSRYYGWKKGYDFFYDGFGLESKFSKIDTLFQKIRKTVRILGFFTGSARGTAPEINSIAKRFLKRNLKERIFLHLHYMDVHEPYDPQPKLFKELTGKDFSLTKRIKLKHILTKVMRNPEYFSNLTEEGKKLVVDSYDTSIRYVDHYVRELVSFIKNSGVFDDLLLILTADHGQELGDHGCFMHGRLYDEVIHIPLILWSPKNFDKIEVDELVRMIDIPATILHILNVQIPKTFRGKSVLPIINGKKENRILIARNWARNFYWGIRTTRYKYIMTFDGKMENLVNEELYDLQEDPNEQNNVINERDKLRATLKQSLMEIIKSALEKEERITKETKMRFSP